MKKRMLTLPLLSLAICGYAQAQADRIEGNPVMRHPRSRLPRMKLSPVMIGRLLSVAKSYRDKEHLPSKFHLPFYHKTARSA
jgi:hypothetical protein